MHRRALRLLLALLAVPPLLALGQLRVETDDAVYHGRQLSLNTQLPGLRTVAHLGIPYAQPPLGPLRFAPPLPWQPPPPANTTDGGGDEGELTPLFDAPKPELNATRAGPACLQRPDPAGTPARMSEDCLYLNVHSPSTGAPPSGAGRRVLVWLHGGYFETGSVSDPTGADGAAAAFAWDLVASQPNLMAVEVAYRLGVFGFLSGLADVGGNAGLQDQRLALEWIARNIGHFGGDNGSVTLAGLDAGAASVGFQLLAEGGRDLFQRCAFFGGSPLAGWAFVRDRAALGRAHGDFYRLAGCQFEDQRRTLACLRNISAAELNARQAEFNRAFDRVEFPAVVDGRFLTADPLEAFERGRFEAKAALIGATSLEGAQLAYRTMIAFNVSGSSDLVGPVHRDLLEGAFRYLPRFPEQPSQLARDFLTAQLTAYASESTGQGNLDLLTRALSQRVTVCESNRFADQLSNQHSNQSAASLVFAYLLAEPDPSVDYRGAGHGRDAAYFVGEPLRRVDYDSEQQTLSRLMMSQLYSFLASGNVSQTGWQPTSAPGLQYFRFLAPRAGSGPGSGMLRGGYDRQECRLWDELLPRLGSATTATTTQATQPTATTATGDAEAKFWERCNTSVNTVSVIAISIGGGLALLLIVCVVLVARGGRRRNSHDSVELYQRVAPVVVTNK